MCYVSAVPRTPDKRWASEVHADDLTDTARREYEVWRKERAAAIAQMDATKAARCLTALRARIRTVLGVTIPTPTTNEVEIAGLRFRATSSGALQIHRTCRKCGSEFWVKIHYRREILDEAVGLGDMADGHNWFCPQASIAVSASLHGRLEEIVLDLTREIRKELGVDRDHFNGLQPFDYQHFAD